MLFPFRYAEKFKSPSNRKATKLRKVSKFRTTPTDHQNEMDRINKVESTVES